MLLPHALPEPAEDWALFLDVDGTLLEIADQPEAVSVDPRLRAILAALAGRFDGALALVSGRPLATLDRLFAPLELTAAGLHGLERRDAQGRIHRTAVPADSLAEARTAVAAFAARHPGLLIEDKGVTVALHYRRAPALAEDCQRFIEGLAARLGKAFLVQHGKMVLEIRPRGPDKGDVVAAFLAEPPFAGRRPVFIGDDVTDEDAFSVVNAAGGHSIRVGRRRPTAASWHVGSVADLRDWLTAIAGLDFVAAAPSEHRFDEGS